MKPWKTYKNTFPIHGKPIECTVCIYVEASDLSLEDVVGDAEDIEALSRRVERGDLMIADVVVKYRAAGFTGMDSLGAVYVERPEDVDTCLIEHGMEENARMDLERVMTEAFESLKSILNK